MQALEAWLRAYQPETLFDQEGRLAAGLRTLAPTGARRVSANPHADGGALRRPLALPGRTHTACRSPRPAPPTRRPRRRWAPICGT